MNIFFDMYIFFGEVSVMVFNPFFFLNQVFVTLLLNLSSLCIFHNSFLRCIFYSYFLLIYDLSSAQKKIMPRELEIF